MEWRVILGALFLVILLAAVGMYAYSLKYPLIFPDASGNVYIINEASGERTRGYHHGRHVNYYW